MFPKIKLTNCLILFFASAFQAFGMYNIHALADITEGGVLGAVFLMGIGGKLKSGRIHDGRAPDYDDWSLNGDILLYDPLLDISLEVSSMGIRVDPESLLRQLRERGCEERLQLPFQKALMNGELPQTVGGGIGQSRMCVYLLRKAHVGEVQSSLWPEDVMRACHENRIQLL